MNDIQNTLPMEKHKYIIYSTSNSIEKFRIQLKNEQFISNNVRCFQLNDFKFFTHKKKTKPVWPPTIHLHHPH